MNVKILYEGSALLRRSSSPVTLPLGDEVFELVEALKRGIRYKDKIWKDKGLSLAAPQIGVLKQVFVITRPQLWNTYRQRAFDTVVNPVILDVSNDTEQDWEGCLSVPHYEYLVERPGSILTQFFNYRGKKIEAEFHGFYARIFQHEVDHLHGVLMSDKALDKRPIQKSKIS